MSMEVGSVVTVVTEQFVSGDQLGRLACELETNEWVLFPKTGLLTDAEREAILFFAAIHNEGYGLFATHTDTLRNLLERLK
jgi:hypothetical protein